MRHLPWLAAFFGIGAFYFIGRLWPLGIVLHCLLIFAWLAAQSGSWSRET